MESMGEAEKQKLIQKTAALSLVLTIVVVAVKLVGAWLSGSISVLGEGVQSLLDIFMAALALYAVRVSAAPPDQDHPSGHGKAELLASAFQMLLAMASAGWIIWQAGLRLMHPVPIKPDWGLVTMIYAIGSNFIVIGILKRVISLTGSEMLASERSHLFSDTWSTVGVIVGLLLFRLTNLDWIDPATAILFTGIGASMAYRKLNDVLHPLMDGALPGNEIQEVQKALDSHPEVRGYHKLRTRFTGNVRMVDLHVQLDDDLTFIQAHDLAEEIEKEISFVLGGAVVTIHYEPFEAEKEHQLKEH